MLSPRRGRRASAWRGLGWVKCDLSVTYRCSAAGTSATEAAVGGAAAQLLAGAVGVMGEVGAVVLVETGGLGGVELGLDGVCVGALGVDERGCVRDLH
jgi:hypothetical protein